MTTPTEDKVREVMRLADRLFEAGVHEANTAEGTTADACAEAARKSAVARTALESAVRAMVPDWRPIAEAPKRRKVLVAYRNQLGNWRRVLACYYPPETLGSETDESGWCEEGWYEEAEAAETIYPVEHPPELYMPLPPAPPAEQKDMPK